MMYSVTGAWGQKTGDRNRRIVTIWLYTYHLPRYQRDALPPLLETMSGPSEAAVTPVNQLAGLQVKPAEQLEEPHQWKLLQEFLIIPAPA